ncbi:hypothetical protein [Streptomyces sp. NPDC059743]|uniref:hypothetical protein n=1 Tax=Streptomyces sp. NPDC059743 TaxID=3346928 RepID=UPI0036594320
MSVRVFRHVHRERSHRTLDGSTALPEIEAARLEAMLEAVAISRGLPAEKGPDLYAAWVEAEQPTGCTCGTCTVVRTALEIEQARLDVGAYRDTEGFWVFPQGLPDGETYRGNYQSAPGVWVRMPG